MIYKDIKVKPDDDVKTLETLHNNTLLISKEEKPIDTIVKSSDSVELNVKPKNPSDWDFDIDLHHMTHIHPDNVIGRLKNFDIYKQNITVKDFHFNIKQFPISKVNTDFQHDIMGLPRHYQKGFKPSGHTGEWVPSPDDKRNSEIFGDDKFQTDSISTTKQQPDFESVWKQIEEQKANKINSNPQDKDKIEEHYEKVKQSVKKKYNRPITFKSVKASKLPDETVFNMGKVKTEKDDKELNDWMDNMSKRNKEEVARKLQKAKTRENFARAAKSGQDRKIVKDTLNDIIATIEDNDNEEKSKRRRNEKQLGEGYVKEEAKIIEESKKAKFKKFRDVLVKNANAKKNKMVFDEASPPLPPSSKKGATKLNDDDDEELPSAPEKGKKILINFGSEDKVNIEMLLKPGKGKKISNPDIATIRKLFDNDKNIEDNMSLVQLKAYIKYAYKSNIQF